MSKRLAPYMHANGTACWTRNCSLGNGVLPGVTDAQLHAFLHETPPTLNEDSAVPVSSFLLTRAAKRVLAHAEEFLDYCGNELEFANHSDPDHGDYLLLADMADGNKARNNCWIVSSEILETSSSGEFGGDDPQIVALGGDGEFHAAVTSWVEDDYYVVDFTARQFDQDLPFPLVTDQNTWKALIEARTGRTLNFTQADAGDQDEVDEED